MRRTIVFFVLLIGALSASARDQSRFSYVYARNGGDTITLTHGSLDDVLRLRKRFTGTYLWAIVDGREYLIRDSATLDEIRRAAAGLEALGPDQRALNAKMKPLERREEKLERELDALTDDDDGDDTVENRSRIRELESQIRDVERELRQYEREESRLDRREEELDRVFDAEVERIVERAIRDGIAERP